MDHAGCSHNRQLRIIDPSSSCSSVGALSEAAVLPPAPPHDGNPANAASIPDAAASGGGGGGLPRSLSALASRARSALEITSSRISGGLRRGGHHSGARFGGHKAGAAAAAAAALGGVRRSRASHSAADVHRHALPSPTPAPSTTGDSLGVVGTGADMVGAHPLLPVLPIAGGDTADALHGKSDYTAVFVIFVMYTLVGIAATSLLAWRAWRRSAISSATRSQGKKIDRARRAGLESVDAAAAAPAEGSDEPMAPVLDAALERREARRRVGAAAAFDGDGAGADESSLPTQASLKARP